MSGLAGIVDFDGRPVAAGLVERLCQPVSHRGPDGRRIALHGNAGFCHLALHTTGESRLEAQPLHAPEPGVLLVADLRLDNRRELGAALLLPETTGDASLLLAAYLRWGESCLDHLLGDFAFVLWDARAGRLFAACDPLGVKPLHYARLGSALVFASEARQILEHPAASAEIDLESIADFLVSNPEEPGRTFFRHLRRLPPAHRLAASRLGQQVTPYWSIDPDRRTIYRDPGQYAEHLREVLARSVGDRLRTDAPAVAVAMSGGLDSGSVAALARRTPGAPLVLACSYTFEHLRECDERDCIEAIVRQLSLPVAYVKAEERWLFGDAEAFRPDLESPLLSWESCFRELLAHARSVGARVLLTGHGGDDVLGGSPLAYLDRLKRGDLRVIFEIVSMARRSGRDWRRALWRCLGEPLLPPAVGYGLRRFAGKPVVPPIPDWLDAGFVRRMGLAERSRRGPSPTRFREASRQEIHDGAVGWTDGHQAVYWYDRSAARAGIEVRHPFLDRRVVEFAVSLPPSQLFEVGCYKPLLRRAMAGILPDLVVRRPAKARLGQYLDTSLREQSRPVLEELLAAPLLAEWGIADADRLRAAYRAYCAGPPDENGRRLWYAFILEIWLREHCGRIAADSAQPAAAGGTIA